MEGREVKETFLVLGLDLKDDALVRKGREEEAMRPFRNRNLVLLFVVTAP